MKNILIVDDNPEIVKLLSRILQENGYSVSNVNLGKFFDLIKEQAFYAVIIDAPLPGYDGTTILDELEQKGILTRQKIILFTPLDLSDQFIDQWKKKGLYSYIEKPATVDIILKTISNIPEIPTEELIKQREESDSTVKSLAALKSSASLIKLKMDSLKKK